MSVAKKKSRSAKKSRLPLPTSLAPMEAQSVDALPEGDGWQYEPKWDGFRCLAFRDGDAIELRSKAGQSLGRYFPEVVAALAALGAERFVLDGELVVPMQRRLSFDDLLLRIHPAASRVAKLSAESPASFIVFDLLADDAGRSLADEPLAARRPALERFAAWWMRGSERVLLSPATASVAEARRWFRTAGGGLDGIIAKRLDAPYRAGDRTAMRKMKYRKTADCVVGGFRYASKQQVIGSLLLGLYDEEGLLHHVGFTSSLTSEQREALVPVLERLIAPPGFTGKAPGGPSRWSTSRSAEWKPLAPKLVVEVEYDHYSQGRFRHGTKFLRWRKDKRPRACTLEQVLAGRGSALTLLRARVRSGTRS